MRSSFVPTSLLLVMLAFAGCVHRILPTSFTPEPRVTCVSAHAREGFICYTREFMQAVRTRRCTCPRRFVLTFTDIRFVNLDPRYAARVSGLSEAQRINFLLGQILSERQCRRRDVLMIEGLPYEVIASTDDEMLDPNETTEHILRRDFYSCGYRP